MQVTTVYLKGGGQFDVRSGAVTVHYMTRENAITGIDFDETDFDKSKPLFLDMDEVAAVITRKA